MLDGGTLPLTIDCYLNSLVMVPVCLGVLL